ncbi:MAG TPA: mutarotase, partial [Verrucomicrobiae bacterium]|nr:mutarotase [Verrucomicrobiae bacterium]
VMIQGFPAGDGLETIRHRLRETFRAKGFADLLDRRYAVRAAHMTVMRFCRPANWAGLVPLLEQGRRLEFGTGRVEELQLVFGDWYASRGVTRTMARYSLVSSG